jgi:pimeloyl-ACP methyl ester carboxylesterase
MPRTRHGEIAIEYSVEGPSDGRPLVLVRGLGTQMIQWDARFRRRLVEAGHRLITFDNRDAGLSTHLDHAPPPSLPEIVQDLAAGRIPNVPYRLVDMAEDIIGVMDALEIERAHLAGISMGGMLVQQAAISHPARVRSLVSIMSTTGEPGLPGPTPEASATLTNPAPHERSAYIEHSLETARVIGSPGFPFDETGYAELMGQTFDRAFDPKGIARQLAAVIAGGDRLAALEGLRLPSLVIHGDADPLIPLAAGEATARAIPGAQLLVVAGMGHDLPEGAWPSLSEAISSHTRAAEVG